MQLLRKSHVTRIKPKVDRRSKTSDVAIIKESTFTSAVTFIYKKKKILFYLLYSVWQDGTLNTHHMLLKTKAQHVTWTLNFPLLKDVEYVKPYSQKHDLCWSAHESFRRITSFDLFICSYMYNSKKSHYIAMFVALLWFCTRLLCASLFTHQSCDKDTSLASFVRSIYLYILSYPLKQFIFVKTRMILHSYFPTF